MEWSESAEGPWYLCNGVRVNFIADATPEPGMSDYDAYSTSPAFLPSTGPGTGAVETWRRYMRIGINANRLHQSTPTQHMMDAADEVGFMLQPETAIRFDCPLPMTPLFLQSVQELAHATRIHPSTFSFSLLNEVRLPEPATLPSNPVEKSVSQKVPIAVLNYEVEPQKGRARASTVVARHRGSSVGHCTHADPAAFCVLHAQCTHNVLCVC